MDKRISVPVPLLLRLRMIAAQHPEAAEVDLLLEANRDRIDRKLKEQAANRARWAYQRGLGYFRNHRPDLTEAQAAAAYRFSSEHARKLFEAYEALGQSEGR